MRYSFFFLLFSVWVLGVHAAGKTSIYIDQIPLYSKLPECAEGRLSAIVRAQYSGCGDDMSLTSFSCFCIDSSSYVNSVLAANSASIEEMCTDVGSYKGILEHNIDSCARGM